MKKVDVSVAIICLACLIMLFMSGGSSLAMAEEAPHLTAEQAIAAARRNAKPGSSFTILWKIIANADTRRIGDQALEQAQARKIEPYENGILVNILRSGGYLLAETNPRTNNMVATHLVLMEAGGAVKDVQTECHGVVKLADAGELVKDTAELVKQLYSTPSTEESSLASRFYGGNFPEADQFPDSLFTIPDSLRKTGANPNEVRDMLKAEFLQSNKLDPNINPIDFDNIQSERQLQERIELLTRLDRFLEDSLRKEADPAVVRQNLSMLTMPLSVDVDLNQEGQYVSTSPPKLLFLWHRLATGGFAVKEITWDW